VGGSRPRESPTGKRRQGREKNRTGRKAETRRLLVLDTERRADLPGSANSGFRRAKNHLSDSPNPHDQENKMPDG
jgi:hypothetical protein